MEVNYGLVNEIDEFINQHGASRQFFYALVELCRKTGEEISKDGDLQSAAFWIVMSEKINDAMKNY